MESRSEIEFGNTILNFRVKLIAYVPSTFLIT